MGFSRVAAAFLALASAHTSSAPHPPVEQIATLPSGHPFGRLNFAAIAVRDPGLAFDSHAPSASGLRAYRLVERPAVGGFLEPSEGVVGKCGGLFYAAVPLDTGSAAGIAGWLLYRPREPAHVAVVSGSQSLEFRHDRIRTTGKHRIDSWACNATGPFLVRSNVKP